MIEAVPEPGQFLVVQEHHEVGQDRIAIDAARADLAHQVHAHRITAEREEGAVAERKDAAIAPDQVEREREQRVAEILADQRHDVGRDIEGALRRGGEVEQRHDDGRRQQDEDGEGDAAVGTEEALCDHASTALPFNANRPRGRFWMNRMISTSTTILPSTAPA